MELIYMDRNRVEQGILSDVSVDIDIGASNDFEIISAMSSENVLDIGMGFCSYGTELGGMIKGLKVDTASETISYYGKTWRGILNEKIIEPPSGNDYRTVSGTDVSIVEALLLEFGVTSLFEVTGIATAISTYRFDRYVSFNQGIDAMLASIDKKLTFFYDETTSKVVLESKDIEDYSEQVEFSKDGNIDIVVEDNDTSPNHLICLGKGDLKDREVVHLYINGDGAISFTQYYFGLDEREAVYANNATDDLTTDGTEYFEGLRNNKSIEVTVEDIDLDIYDVVAARDYITGTYSQKAIAQKIVSIDYEGNISCQYKTGERILK